MLGKTIEVIVCQNFYPRHDISFHFFYFLLILKIIERLSEMFYIGGILNNIGTIFGHLIFRVLNRHFIFIMLSI